MKKNSLASLIKVASLDISQDLISTECIDRLCLLAQYFPIAITSLFGFETSLISSESIVDFFFCTENKELLAHNSSSTTRDNNQQISPLILEQPIWQKIHNFANQWANPESAANQIEDVWLEFDFIQTQANIPIPSLFFAGEHLGGEDDYFWCVDNILSKLCSQPLSSNVRKTFSHCLTSLPSNLSPFQIGVLLPRQEQLRIYLSFISYHQLLDYLRQINWQGNLSLWEYLCSQFAPWVSYFQLQLEITDSLSPEIAIELHPNSGNSWSKILNYLTKIGFCVPAKKEALLAYQGLSKVEDNQFDGHTESSWYRELGYLKMSYQPNQPISFKAYLLVINTVNK